MARGWLGTALVGLLVLAGCSPFAERASGPSAPTGAAAAPGRLAYIAEDDHIYTIAAAGGDPRRVDAIPGEQPVAGEIRISRWPTWTPDGSRLAFMRLRSGEGDAPATATVWMVAPDGSDLAKLWESQDQAPIYMAWSPDGSTLSLLVQGGDSLTLLLIDPGGSRPPRPVADGNPLYFSWSPDATALLLHVGGDHRDNQQADLSVVRPGPSDERRPLGPAPAEFRAPAWSPDGARLAFVAEGPERGALLTVSNPQGGDAVRLASIGEEAAFVWAPEGDRLAFASRLPSAPLYQGLEVVNGDGTDRAQVTQEAVIAFFWSPDGKKLAFAAFDRQSEALAWHVADASGKNAKPVGAFLPSQEQLRLFFFFDQYAQSHGLWSPDSRYLVYAGLPAGSRPEPKSAPRNRVFVVPADGSAEPKALVDGNLGVWPAGTPKAR
jgi:TolB protein